MAIKEKKFDISGAILYWTAGGYTDVVKFKDALANLGLERFAPPPDSVTCTLRAAIDKTCMTETELVRPLKAKDGFTIVNEARGDEGNQYDGKGTVKIDKAERLSFVDWHLGKERKDEIVDNYARFAKIVHPAQVSAALVRMMADLGGVRLRPQGAIYWLPERALQAWGDIIEAFESAVTDDDEDAKGTNVGYMLRTAMDDKAMRAVMDAIVAEAEAEAQRINDEVDAGDLGERALKTRVQQAKDMAAKVAEYESYLGRKLTEQRKALETAEVAAAKAALLAAADDDKATAPPTKRRAA